MAPKAVLFDVDGTLADTNYLHTLAWWRALQDHGQTAPMAAIHRLVGMGSSELLAELIGHPDDEISEAQSLEYQRMKGEITPLPGARELVCGVSDRGACVVFATSAKQQDIDDLLRALDVTDRVDHVINSADVEAAKPSGDIFEAGLRAAGTDTQDSLVVGDTVWDVEAASKVGLKVAAVETGGNGRLELLEAGAVSVHRDAAHLVSEIDESPLGRLLAR